MGLGLIFCKLHLKSTWVRRLSRMLIYSILLAYFELENLSLNAFGNIVILKNWVHYNLNGKALLTPLWL